MNREGWFVFAALAAASAVILLGVTAWQKNEELGRTRAELVRVRSSAGEQATSLGETQRELAGLRQRAEALAREVAAVTNTQRRLESEMRAAVESRDVAISALQGRLTVSILDRILFDSGEAQLKPEGMQVLDQVAKVLAGFTNRQVQVFGHTDNVPIRLRYPSNWELSTARAVAAVRYLSEKANVDARRLSAVGCGEFQPIADNATAEGRARNRRIALVVLPEQFVPTDVLVTNAPPAEGGASSTNAPAAGATNAPASAATLHAVPADSGVPATNAASGPVPEATNAAAPAAGPTP